MYQRPPTFFWKYCRDPQIGRHRKNGIEWNWGIGTKIMDGNPATFSVCDFGWICGNAQSYAWDYLCFQIRWRAQIGRVNGCQKKLVPRIIGGYHQPIQTHLYHPRPKTNPQFAWQPRFYDVIIKNEKSFHNISRYIKMNPAKWQRDRNKQNGLFF